MNILSIETSCDETAISIIKAEGDAKNAHFEVLGNTLLSQIDIHKEYGGVFPMLAKREHAKNLIPILQETLKEAALLEEKKGEVMDTTALETILEREPELLKQFLDFIPTIEKPNIDAIAVTHGPGLEPALWVGINFARALAHMWNLPIIPVNHMEGHIFSGILQETKPRLYDISYNSFPLLALLISGGHTELVLIKNWGDYETVGSTRDDAVGEAFDKVARLLGLPYPGGPEISRLAEEARTKNLKLEDEFPRPMLTADNLDFSFSGLKTAVLYYTKDKTLSDEAKQKIAREFEDAVTDVLVHKTLSALELHGAQTLVVGGGVSANKHIRRELETKLKEVGSSVFIPKQSLTTDNAVMIAVAGYFSYLDKKVTDTKTPLVADGNLSL